MRYLLWGVWLLTFPLYAQVTVAEDSIELKNKSLTLHQTLEGSAITALRLAENSTNPFAWQLPVSNQPVVNQGGYPFRGHFISVGTGGLPSAGEQRRGVRLYGEANAARWQLVDRQVTPSGSIVCRTAFKDTTEYLSVRRQITLDRDAPVLKITEEVTNGLPIGRAYNFLQHATFGGAFVDSHLLINSNAGPGFYQKGAYPRDHYDSLEAYAYAWPHGVLPDGPVDLRTTTARAKTYLSSHVFADSVTYGWAVAANPSRHLLVGYLWDVEEYPWLHVWQQYTHGKVSGRAIEFATVGAGLSFEELMKNDYRFFDRQSFEFIDTGETITKSYYLFAVEIPSDFQAVTKVSSKAKSIEISIKTTHGTVIESIRFTSLH